MTEFIDPRMVGSYTKNKETGIVTKVEMVLTKAETVSRHLRQFTGDSDEPIYAVYVKRPYFAGVRKIKLTVEAIDDA